MIKRAVALTLAVLFALCSVCLNGCQLSGFGADSLMRPPKAAGDGAAIQSAMEEKLGTEIALRYPRRGEYRSAIVRADIDNDQMEEAIVFYRTTAETSGAHMVVLDSDAAGVWNIIGQARSNGGDIDTIMFGDIDGDNVLEIITGWSLYSDASHIIAIHSCVMGKLSEIEITGPEETNGQAVYSAMAVADFDNNGRDDIIAAQLGAAPALSVARMYTLRGQKAEPVSSIELDSTVITYTKAQAGQINLQTPALILDGYRSDGRYSTELVVWDKEKRALIAPLNENESHECTLLHSMSTTAADINGDAYIELPSDELLPGYTEDSGSSMYLTRWNRFATNGDLINVSSGLMCSDYGYYFKLNPQLAGLITAAQDKEAKTVTFMRTSDKKAFADELLKIRVFTRDEWNAEEKWSPLDLIPDGDQRSAGYYLLAESDYYIYGALITADSGDPAIGADSLNTDEKLLPLTDYQEIASNFFLL